MRKEVIEMGRREERGMGRRRVGGREERVKWREGEEGDEKGKNKAGIVEGMRCE